MPSGIWLYSYMVLWGLLLFVSLLLFGVFRQLQMLHRYWIQNDPDWGLPLGALAPAISGTDVYGRPVSLGSTRGRMTLIFFVSRGCPACKSMMSLVPPLSDEPSIDLLLVVGGHPGEVRLHLAEFNRETEFPGVLAVANLDRDYMNQYKVTSVPHAVVVDEDGRIAAKGSPHSLVEASILVAQAEQMRDQRRARIVPAPAPLAETEAQQPEPALA